MKANAAYLLALAFIFTGCDPNRQRADEANHLDRQETVFSVESADIVQSLREKDRASVHVALWTLRQNGMLFPDADSVDFNASYSESSTVLKSIADELEKSSPDELASLNKSLNYHWGIYSPIWLDTAWK